MSDDFNASAEDGGQAKRQTAGNQSEGEREATDYTVGYGRPPVHTRFQKGASGNPRGRSPGSKNLDTLFDKELDTEILVTEGGKEKTRTKREIIAAQLVNKSAGPSAQSRSPPLRRTGALRNPQDRGGVNDVGS